MIKKHFSVLIIATGVIIALCIISLNYFSSLFSAWTQPISLTQEEKEILPKQLEPSPKIVQREGSFLVGSGSELASFDVAGLEQEGYYFINQAKNKVYYLKEHLGFDANSDKELPRGVFEEIPVVDFETFYVSDIHSAYAFDREKVYFIKNIPFSNLNEFYFIENADPETFEPKISRFFDVSTGNTYIDLLARDENGVFYGNEPIIGADPETFVVTNSVALNYDKDHIFIYWKLVPDADPDTFEILLGTGTHFPGTVYSKDKNHFFVDYQVVSGVDVNTVEFVEYKKDEGYLFSDKNGIFNVTKISQDAEWEITRI